MLALARSAIASGGAVPAVVNAANEVAVAAFLEKKLTFPGIAEVVTETAERLRTEASRAETVEDIFSFDARARAVANEILALRF